MAVLTFILFSPATELMIWLHPYRYKVPIHPDYLDFIHDFGAGAFTEFFLFAPMFLAGKKKGPATDDQWNKERHIQSKQRKTGGTEGITNSILVFSFCNSKTTKIRFSSIHFRTEGEW